jgi:hypothetical protein
MPIVYATLSLTAQSDATDYVDLKAAYLDTGLELNEYDYSLTTGDYFSYTSYTAIDYGETSITFDVTAHIYEMYADKKFDDENGYDYHGDFVIGYDYASDTTYVPPFYSSEYTTPSVRPVFTVKYGYTLPAGMMNGSVYSFVNAGSGSNMSVNGSSPANNSNIYQVWNESGVATTTQKFKLEYVSGTGGYLLRSMSSSSGTDKVVSINRANGELTTNMNVRLSSAIDSMALVEASDMPGYDDKIIMASGSFTQGSSIELSCDGPMREPYIAYMQGGLTYNYGKLGVMKAVERLLKCE